MLTSTDEKSCIFSLDWFHTYQSELEFLLIQTIHSTTIDNKVSLADQTLSSHSTKPFISESVTISHVKSSLTLK